MKPMGVLQMFYTYIINPYYYRFLNGYELVFFLGYFFSIFQTKYFIFGKKYEKNIHHFLQKKKNIN
jgi:hypothetical protein